LSSDQHTVIAPVRGTPPTVGRSPLTPQRMLVLTMLPPVSLPIEKPTRPAVVAAPGLALDPEVPSSSNHGVMVCPPRQLSFSARPPKLSLTTNAAPASSKRCTAAASLAGIRLRKRFFTMTTTALTPLSTSFRVPFGLIRCLGRASSHDGPFPVCEASHHGRFRGIGVRDWIRFAAIDRKSVV